MRCINEKKNRFECRIQEITVDAVKNIRRLFDKKRKCLKKEICVLYKGT